VAEPDGSPHGPLEFYGKLTLYRTSHCEKSLREIPAKIFRGFNRLFSAFFNTLATNSGLVSRPRGGGRNRRGQRQESWMLRLVARFLRDESGATAIEYCLIATGIAFAIIATVQGIGPQLNTKFVSVNNSLK
jgi:pilus assembly protein Flp/PilA